MKYAIATDKAPKPAGIYSQGTSAARYIFISGQLPIDPATNEFIPSSNFKDKVECCLYNIEACLEDVSMSREDVTELTVYLTNLDMVSAVNEAFEEFFFPPYPARSVLEVSRLPKNSELMISAIACR